MILSCLFLSFSLFAFEHTYLQKQFEQKMLSSIAFDSYEKDAPYLNGMMNLSTSLHAHIIGEMNPSSKHEYIFWYKDLQIKHFVICTLWQINARQKVTFDPIIYKLDDFLGDNGKTLLYTRIAICKQEIIQLTGQDHAWLMDNKSFTEALFPRYQFTYLKFLSWVIMEKIGYSVTMKKKYKEIIEELLQELPISLHAIPSVKNYIQKKHLLNINTQDNEQNQYLGIIPASYLSAQS